nr:hypothetical protein [uncultured Gellertiella sp.]
MPNQATFIPLMFSRVTWRELVLPGIAVAAQKTSLELFAGRIPAGQALPLAV